MEGQNNGGKGWMSNLIRESRVGERDYQAVIPPLLHRNEAQRVRLLEEYKRKRTPYLERLKVFTPAKIPSEEAVREYLSFACSIALKDSKNDNDGLLIGLPSAN